MIIAAKWLGLIGYFTSAIALLFIYTGIYSRLHPGGHDVWGMIYVGLVGLTMGVGLILRKRWGAMMAAIVFAGVTVFILHDSVVYIFASHHNIQTSARLIITAAVLIVIVQAIAASGAFVWLIKKAWMELS